MHRALLPVVVGTGAGLLGTDNVSRTQRRGDQDGHRRLAEKPRGDNPTEVLPQPPHRRVAYHAASSGVKTQQGVGSR
jgi:hypothetical protein